MARFDVGDALTRTFGIVFGNLPAYLRTQGVFIVLAGAVSLVGVLVVYEPALADFRPEDFEGPEDALRLLGALAGWGFLLGVVGFILSVLGALVGVVVTDAILRGEDPSLAAAWERARTRVWNYVLTVLAVALAFLGILLASAVLAILIVPFFLAVGVIVYLALRWAVAPSVSALEERDVLGNLKRSGDLTDGSKGGVFVVFLVVFLAGFAASAVATVLSGDFPRFDVSGPDSPGAGPEVRSSLVLRTVLGTVVNLVIPPLFAAANVVVYRSLGEPPPEPGPISPGPPAG